MNIIQKTFYLLCITCMTAKAQDTALVQRWLKQNGAQSGNYKNNTIVDAKGNCYLSGARKNFGNSTHDGYVSKVSPEGHVIWTYNFIGIGNGDDVVISAKLDSHENIYFTGTTFQSNSNNNDLFVAKLDRDGILLWSRTFNGSGSGFDSGGDLILDEFENIYVAGVSMSSTTMLDFIVLKYDNLGNQVWERNFDYLGLNDAATKLLLIGDSVYVSGISQISNNNWELSTVCLNKLNGDIGNQIISGGSGNGLDKLNEITFDNDGNIYLTGAVLNSNSYYDARVTKLNPNLTIAWSKDFNGTDNLDDESLDIKVDQDGNVYIAGYTTKSAELKNILLIKYNSLGDTIFTKSINGLGNDNDQANGICIGPDGSIYITGSVKSTWEDIITFKISAWGDLLKSKTFSSSGNSKATSIKMAPYGALVITGQTEENGIKKNIAINYLENIELPEVSSNNIVSNGAFRYLDNMLMVRFHPACFNLDVMDNKKLHNQSFGIFMKDSVLKILTQIFYGNMHPSNV